MVSKKIYKWSVKILKWSVLQWSVVNYKMVSFFIYVSVKNSNLDSKMQIWSTEEKRRKDIYVSHTSHLYQRWNWSGFLTTSTGTGLSRPDRTGPVGLPVIDRSTGNWPVYRRPAGLPVIDRSTGNWPVYRYPARLKSVRHNRRKEKKVNHTITHFDFHTYHLI